MSGLSDVTLTEVEEVRKFLGTTPDRLNLLVATEASCHNEDGDERFLHPWQEGTTFQAEGFILQPRKGRHAYFEVVTSDPEEAVYIVLAARDSQAPLAQQAAGAMALTLEAEMLANDLAHRLDREEKKV